VPQQARAVAITPNDLDQATGAAPKNVEITSGRIPLQTLLSQTHKAREHMTTEHTVVRSGKLKRKPFNSNVAGHLLTIATFGFGYAIVRYIGYFVRERRRLRGLMEAAKRDQISNSDTT
jgi:hypothetical protein